MSDSNYAKSICKWRKINEVVDDAWLEDALSDDDVEIPGGDVFAEEGARPASPRAETRPMMLSKYLLLSTALRDDHTFYTPRSLRTEPVRRPPRAAAEAALDPVPAQASSTRATCSRRPRRSGGRTSSSSRSRATRP